jgi:hypothetical protein
MVDLHILHMHMDSPLRVEGFFHLVVNRFFRSMANVPELIIL